MIAEKEKKENQNVIAIKGLEVNEYVEVANVTVMRFLKDRLNVDVDIRQSDVKVRGRVTIIRLKSGEDKERIMQNKNKLAGSKIFIEHYRSFEERKRQEEIAIWAKEQKERGHQVRIGFGKISYNNEWFRWENRDKLIDKMRKEMIKDKQNKDSNKETEFTNEEAKAKEKNNTEEGNF